MSNPFMASRPRRQEPKSENDDMPHITCVTCHQKVVKQAGTDYWVHADDQIRVSGGRVTVEYANHEAQPDVIDAVVKETL